jgi:hypothetical protein
MTSSSVKNISSIHLTSMISFTNTINKNWSIIALFLQDFCRFRQIRTVLTFRWLLKSRSFKAHIFREILLYQSFCTWYKNKRRCQWSQFTVPLKIINDYDRIDRTDSDFSPRHKTLWIILNKLTWIYIGKYLQWLSFFTSYPSMLRISYPSERLFVSMGVYDTWTFHKVIKSFI